MSESALITQQRALLRDLIHQAAERARNEPAITTMLREQVDQVEIEYAEAREEIERQRTREWEENEQRIEQARKSIETRYTIDQDAASQEFSEKRRQILEREEREKEAAKTAYQEACWTAAAVLEGAKNEAEQELRDNKSRLQARLDELHDIHQQARALLKQWKQPAEEIEADVDASLSTTENAPPTKLSECVTEARQWLEQLQQLARPIVWSLLRTILPRIARKQVRAVYEPLYRIIVHPQNAPEIAH